MKQITAVAVTVLTAAAVAGAAPALADPAPQPDGPCSENLAGALTQLAEGPSYLECSSAPGNYRWTPFTGPYPTSDRWLSYGPAVTLHGQGMRNPEIRSGRWVAYPQDAGTTCTAEQSTVVSAGQVGPPQTTTGQPGQPLDFEVLPAVFSITLTGNCLWEAVH
ncbi:hypothetical protein [Mycolicibacterium komossense]|jgi:hypothetical protein|uniref:Secreted protein n=1 Tax=Mycolicibacterium komossense TaxID=1779 RepID=A0ABT3C641_9MYCO|nr:hypothetical protein [Mycolicibacterium komossense]MCV7224929.1 hypothetical protein [Mycolicibacterium komossense]